MNVLKSIVIFLAAILSFTTVYSQKKKTQPTEHQIRAYVTDKTGTLTQSQISSLEKKLSGFEKETSNQVIVYMMSTLSGESLEETSIEIAEKNGIGQKGKNNGVLLFIVKDDRKLRIEVGYGLEGALPDALCNQIIRKEITPYFKQGKFYEGIDAGVNAIIEATKGEYKQDKKESGDDNFGFGLCCIPFPAIIFIVIFGLLFFIPIFKRIFGLGGSRRGNWFFTGGSSSGSSWSSGSSSFGGFSGGGGSFGGGGSSGSW